MSPTQRTVLAILGLAVALEMGCLSGFLFFLCAADAFPTPDSIQAQAVAVMARVVLGTPMSPASPMQPPTHTPTQVLPTATPRPPIPTNTKVIRPATPTSVPPMPVETPHVTSTLLPTPPPATEVSEAQGEHANLVIVIWDGTQRAHLLEMLEHGDLPNLQRLLGQSHGLILPAIDSMTCEPGSGDSYRTETGPGNSALAAGVGYPGMANWRNTEPHPIPKNLTIWEWFKERGYVTAIVSSKDEPFWPLPPLQNARPQIDYWRVGHHPQSWVTDGALWFVEAYARHPLFLWVHYKEPDTLGHRLGENSVEYSRSLVTNDIELGRLIGGLQAQALEDDTLLVVTTDHGFNEGGFQHDTCGPDTKQLFLVASKSQTALSGCVESQTDILPCIKSLTHW
jgi:hypothetical protein